MSGDRSKLIRLGLFVIVALALLVVGIYNIGSKKNLFGTNLQISAEFSNIKGALPGNNVRYSGLTVGSVESINIINDSLLRVNMNIDKTFIEHIKKNAIASIGTNGLVGEKVINIIPSNTFSLPIEDGDILQVSMTTETQEMLSTLDQTNKNFLDITEDIKLIANALNENNISINLKNTAQNLEVLSNDLLKLSDDFIIILNDVKEGKGAIGYLLNDPTFSDKTNSLFDNINEQFIQKTAPIITNLETSTISAISLTQKIDSLISQIDLNDGMLGLLLKDSSAVEKTQDILDSLEVSTHLFNENMVALQHNFFFKRYFKKKRKEEEKKNE